MPGYPKRKITRDPEMAGAVLDAVSDPLTGITAAAERLGDKNAKAAIQKFVERMRARGVGTVIDRARQIKTQDFLKKLDTAAYAVLDSIDELDLVQASLKDKAIAVGILLEKRALLRGEPTQIMTYEERKNLNELMPEFLAEAKRRGIAVELTDADYHEVGTAPAVRALPPQEIQEEAVSATARRLRGKLNKQ